MKYFELPNRLDHCHELSVRALYCQPFSLSLLEFRYLEHTEHEQTLTTTTPGIFHFVFPYCSNHFNY